MQKVLTAAQMREVDRLTTERYGIPSILLMENAAHAVARVITEKLGGTVEAKSIVVLCGPGNNGGDGAALARILTLAGADVEVVLLGVRSETKGDARINFNAAYGIVALFHEINNVEKWTSWLEASQRTWDVRVDAIFGTGLNRTASDLFEQVITDMVGDDACSRYEGHRLAVSVDMPSGLIADDADASGPVLEADLTVTFTAPKAANVLENSYSLGGELIVADIGSSWELIDEQSSQLFVSDERDPLLWLSRSDFTFDSYKSKRGHSLIIAGSSEYSGAAVLVANAAMRSGVGLVTLACPAEVKAEVASRLLPEVILLTIDGADLGKADSIAIGCGLDAEDEEIGRLVRDVVTTRSVPVIVDAGGLAVLSPFADVSNWPPTDAGGSDLILTPHEGEFLRLLGTDNKSVLSDRVAAVREFATTNGVILVLKGERVLIGHPDGRVVVNPTGNSGLGKAGNGDTLTGILAGFVAQAVKMDIDIFETVVAAVYVAGMAGDVAEKKYGKRVMTASDVRECLVDVFDSLTNGN